MKFFRQSQLVQALDEALQRIADGLPLPAENARLPWPEPLNHRLPAMAAQLADYRRVMSKLIDPTSDLPEPLEETSGFCDLSRAINIKLERERQRRQEEKELDQWMDAIFQGDYDQKLDETHALNKPLTIKFNQVAERLKALEEARAVRERLAESTEILAQALRGDFDETELSQKLLSHVAKLLGAQSGVCYLQRSDGEYERIGHYALSQRHSVGHKFAVGEGLLGEAIREGELIVVRDVPEDYLPLESAMVKGKARQIILWPIRYLDSIIAAVELATVGEFEQAHIDWLKSQTESVGITFSMAIARAKMSDLLRLSEQKNEELRAQQEELRAQSEELRAQGEAMQNLNAELEEKNEIMTRFQAELEEKNELLQRQQAELEEHNAELERQKTILAEKQVAVERASRYKSEFLANMSHELRTPLNSLLLLSGDLLENEDGNLKDDQLESLAMIKKGGVDLLNLINDILDLSKIEAGQLRVIREPVDLAAQCRELIAMLEPQARKKGIDLKLTIDDSLPDDLYSDGQRVAQILKNLLSNAIKFTDKGKVELGISRLTKTITTDSGKELAEGVIVAVEDTGPGIESSRIEEVFEAFQQGDGSITRRHGGTGLGLSISRQLARRLGGDILLRTEPGKGSCFSLVLPLDGLKGSEKVDDSSTYPSMPRSDKSVETQYEKSVERFPLPEDNPLQDDRDKCGPGDCCLLVIEDDLAFAGTLMKQIRRKNFKALSAVRGQDGIALAQHYKPVGIVLDLGLPDMEGRDVIKVLKSHAETANIPIHVVSARDEDPSLLALGVIEYLQKPITPDALTDLISQFEVFKGGKVKRLLVVEDDDATQTALKKTLAKDSLDLIPARNGTEALDILTKEAVDGMLLDLGLPDMTGRELLEKLATSGYEIPTIVYTGQEISEGEYQKLRQYTDQIVLKGKSGNKRLIDEVALFIHGLTARLKPGGQSVHQIRFDDDSSLENKKILLVDDDVRNAFALNKILRKHGMNVVLANDGQLALDKLEENPDIDLILMDIMMPVMDGYEATRRIRRNEKFQELPIIALTAKAMTEDRKHCLEAGATDYLAKPVDIDKLLSLLRLYLRK